MNPHMKGKLNPNWRGGVAEYPNHAFMKKQRLIILMNNPKCELCKKPAVEIHHRNGNKADHRLKNLMASCRSCNASIRFKPNTSKYRRLYKMTLEEMGKKYGLSQPTVYRRIIENLPLSLRRKRTKSKYYKLYGKTLEELGKPYKLSSSSVCYRLNNNLPLSYPKQME